MFMIMAVIRPTQLHRVRAELLSAGVNGMTVCACSGHGRAPRMVPGLRGGPDVAYLDENVQIEVAVCSEAKDLAIDAIVRGARFEDVGGGKIFVSPVERVISIRTGDVDDLAVAVSPQPPVSAWMEAAE